jgi:hypothetical protein
MATQSLYDLAVLDRADEYTGLIEDVTTLAPEFEVFAAHKRPGTWYKTVKRTTLPTVQFRAINGGVPTSKSTFKSSVKEMFFLDARINMDEAVWEADTAHLGSLWQLEAAGAMRAAAILIGQQTWYGTSADSNGFAGVRNQLTYTVSLQSTTSTTTAYLLWMDEKEGCRYDVGMDGQFAISPPFRQQVTDPVTATSSYFAYVGNLKAWIGFNVMSNLSCWGIVGIQNSTNTAYWMNDNVAAQLLAKIPVARRNNLRWFMNRTGEGSLQRSRSTINLGLPSGSVLGSYQPADAAGRPAFSPLPNSCLGYPITLTDSILDTDSSSAVY